MNLIGFAIDEQAFITFHIDSDIALRRRFTMGLDHGSNLFHYVDAIIRGRQNRLLRLDKQQQVGNHMLKSRAGLTQLHGIAFDILLACSALFHDIGQLFQRLRGFEQLFGHIGDEGVAYLRESHAFADIADQHHHQFVAEFANDDFQPIGP